MGFEERMNKLYSKYDIDFSFLYKDYRLRKIPFDRPVDKNCDYIDEYCYNVRKLYKNINKLVRSGEDDRVAMHAINHFYAVLGKDWEKKISDLEDFIYKYNNRILSVVNNQQVSVDEKDN